MNNISIYDEIKAIESLIEEASLFLSDYKLSGAKHYLSVGENQFAFEYIMLEIIENNIKIEFDNKNLKNIAIHLKMNENECNDDCFWEKFNNYLGML